jgi:hypothetical protein
VLRTTTNGLASVQHRSSVTGTFHISATVGSVSRTIDITYRNAPTIPIPPGTTPTITSITPASGSPAGGERIRINGTNFREPVRVLFDVGANQPVEAFVVSVTPTTIEVITPSVNVGVGQPLISDIIVITQAGTTTEARATAADAFTFRIEQLTPRVSAASPNSGPVTGGTRVTIFGDGFQAPVQVLFGSAEAHIVTVEFSQIIVEAPAGRDTAPNGSGTVTGPVNITVRNINSHTETSLASGFRYVAAMQITAISPAEGLFTGGTRISIDGVGFLAPVAISVAGFPVQPISVTGTKIIAITPAIQIVNCEEESGPVIVTNINNGDTAQGPPFTFRVPRPLVVNVAPSSAAPGANIAVVVANAQPGVNRLRIGTRTIFPTGVTFNSDGTGTFNVTLPLDFEFETAECTVGGVTGERQLPLILDVTYLNVDTGCTDTATEALTIVPPNPNCVLPPPPDLSIVSPPAGNCVQTGNVSVTDPATGTGSITLRNTGGQPLEVIFSGTTGTGAGDYTITPATLSIEPGATGSFTVTFNPSVAGARDADAHFTTNDPDLAEAAFTVCLRGTGTP